MKKSLLKIIGISLVLFCTLNACKKFGMKEHNGKGDCGSDENMALVIDTTISASTKFELNLSIYYDEDDIITIDSQALHFTKSDITKDASGNFVYTYQNDNSGTNSAGDIKVNTSNSGTDKVIVKIAEPAGRKKNYVKTITINFTIQ